MIIETKRDLISKIAHNVDPADCKTGLTDLEQIQCQIRTMFRQCLETKETPFRAEKLSNRYYNILVDGKVVATCKITKQNDIVQDNTIVHESLVGLLLNKLNSLDFIYTYSGFNYADEEFSCSIEGIGSNLYGVLFYQHVPYSMNIMQYIANQYRFKNDSNITSLTRFLSQTFILMGQALNQAQKEYRYMHNNLTYKNVMIRFLSEHTTQLIDDELAIQTNVVPVIKDYSTSSLIYDTIFFPPTDMKAVSNLDSIHQVFDIKSKYFMASYDLFYFILQCMYNLLEFYKEFPLLQQNVFKFFRAIFLIPIRFDVLPKVLLDIEKRPNDDVIAIFYANRPSELATFPAFNNMNDRLFFTTFDNNVIMNSCTKYLKKINLL